MLLYQTLPFTIHGKMPETMKLLGSTKNKIIKDKNGENVPHVEIMEVVLVHCKLFATVINKIQ